MTFPARASSGGGREGCQGLSRKCGPGLRRTRQASPGAGATGGGAPTGGPGEHPSPPRQSPTLTACPPVGGHFALLPATLCRRSPATGMGAAAVGSRAGFRSWVGEHGTPTRGTGERPRLHLQPGAHPARNHYHLRSPSHPWDKGWGRTPRVTFPRSAHAPSLLRRGRGHARSRECGGGSWVPMGGRIAVLGLDPHPMPGS